MTTSFHHAPDIRFARTWLEDAARQLNSLAREHNDQRLSDLALTISDVLTRVNWA